MSPDNTIGPEARERLQTLSSKFESLEAKQAHSDKLLHDLGERMKELDCLYSISEIVDRPGIGIHDIVQSIVDLIPPAWQYPDSTFADISIDSSEFHTTPFRTTDTTQSAPIKVSGNHVGEITVYLERRTPDMTFLTEEQRLLDAIAERLGKIITRKQTERMFDGTDLSPTNNFIEQFRVQQNRVPTLEEIREHTERSYLTYVLNQAKSKVDAAKQAGISRAYLYTLLDRYSIE